VPWTSRTMQIDNPSIYDAFTCSCLVLHFGRQSNYCKAQFLRFAFHTCLHHLLQACLVGPSDEIRNDQERIERPMDPGYFRPFGLSPGFLHFIGLSVWTYYVASSQCYCTSLSPSKWTDRYSTNSHERFLPIGRVDNKLPQQLPWRCGVRVGDPLLFFLRKTSSLLKSASSRN
jgi:hypothetical protein